MTIVTLHGELGRTIGEHWEFLIKKPREVLAAIEANTKSLYKYLKETGPEIEYRILINGKDHGDAAEMYLIGNYDTIDIVPVPAGAGAGIWQTIAGVLLIIVGIVVYYYGGDGTSLIVAGVGLILGGVAAMLSSSPKLGQSNFARSFKNQNEMLQQNKEDSAKTQSYLFSGAANTTTQGNPVSIIYGEMIVGSQLISMRITGAAIDGAIIGEVKPPAATDDYFDEAVWARLDADSRGTPVKTLRLVQGLSVANTIAQAEIFDIPLIDPTTGKRIGVGSKLMPRKTLKGYLRTVCHLFSNTPRGIRIAEARDLYKVLELSSLLNYATAGWREIVMALALYYSPEP